MKPDLRPASIGWAIGIVLLYTACVWFAEVKRRHRHPLLSCR